VTTASRILRISLALAVSAAGCSVDTTMSPAGSGQPSTFDTELNFSPVLARATVPDTARVAGVVGGVAVLGLLNRTAPCFGLSAAASAQGDRVVIRVTATETQGTCNTFAAGAFDYDVSVKTIPVGSYEVEVVHRVAFKDGRVVEATAGGKRVQVK
jgi:hypothetical protein